MIPEKDKITVTEKAAKRLKQMLEKSPINNEEAGIRLAVKGGGCSSFLYIPLTINAKPNKHDDVSESNGIRIFVDPKSLVIVKGTEIDFDNNLIDGGFTFNNPNAKTGCGCGKSFELK